MYCRVSSVIVNVNYRCALLYCIFPHFECVSCSHSHIICNSEEGKGNNPVLAFLKRYKDDLECRKDKFPTKYIRSKAHNDVLQPFRISKSIDRTVDRNAEAK